MHLDTVRDPSREIDEDYLRDHYSVGVYNVVMAIEGQQGLTRFGDFIIAPPVEFVCYYTIRPTIEQISEDYGFGNYLIVRMSNAETFQVFRGDEPSEQDMEVFDRLQAYVPAMRGWGVFRLTEVPL